MLGYFGQAAELASHYLGAADGAVQHAVVEDAPELGRTLFGSENRPTGQTGGYLLVLAMSPASWPAGGAPAAALGKW